MGLTIVQKRQQDLSNYDVYQIIGIMYQHGGTHDNSGKPFVTIADCKDNESNKKAFQASKFRKSYGYRLCGLKICDYIVLDSDVLVLFVGVHFDNEHNRVLQICHQLPRVWFKKSKIHTVM